MIHTRTHWFAPTLSVRADDTSGGDEALEPMIDSLGTPSLRRRARPGQQPQMPPTTRRLPPTLFRWEVFSFALATLIQLGGMIALPMYLYMEGSTVAVSALCGVSCLCLSLAWNPWLHKQLRIPEMEYSQTVRPSFLPHTPRTARAKAYLINSLLRMIFTVIYVAGYAKVDPEFNFTLAGLFPNIRDSPLLTPFLFHLISAFVGYHAARLACLLTIQRVAFALPLLIVSPISLLLFFAWRDFPFISLVRIG